ncbi:ion transporter [Hymenobacter terrenus]|uniref:ion transporter n=1 Tax=Hymenobacter terrenus TaxID=1629124 RepID=UPI000696F8EB|nr:ion transporter [Hymenobacter terrenus]
MSSFRYFVHRALDAEDGGSSTVERFTDTLLISLVLLNTVAVIMESVPHLYQQYRSWFTGIEIISVYVFTLEYVARVWSAVEDRRFRHPISGRLRFAFTPFALIDLLAILPFYLTLGGFDLRFLRVVRLFRVLKVTRYVKALRLIQKVVRRKRPELLVTVGVIAVMLILVSSMMYYVESEAQPDKFGSIPETMWWGVATLTTVGYGDVYPITPLGKILSSLIAVLGLGLFAIPTGLLASGFTEHVTEQHALELTDIDKERDSLKLEINLLRNQLAMKDQLIAAKDETISLLRGGYNRPN